MLTGIKGSVCVVLLAVGIGELVASTVQAAPRRGAFTLICDRAKAVQFWNGVGWNDATVRNIDTTVFNLDARGYSPAKLVIRFDNEKGEFKQYNLTFYEIFGDEKGMLYHLKYDDLLGWDLFEADESDLDGRRQGAFTLVNPFEVDLPVQMWRGRKYSDDTVSKRTKYIFPIDIDQNGSSAYQPQIKFNNGKGKIKTYRLEFQEVAYRGAYGTFYHFTYDELTGWDLKSGEEDE